MGRRCKNETNGANNFVISCNRLLLWEHSGEVSIYFRVNLMCHLDEKHLKIL